MAAKYTCTTGLQSCHRIAGCQRCYQYHMNMVRLASYRRTEPISEFAVTYNCLSNDLPLIAIQPNRVKSQVFLEIVFERTICRLKTLSMWFPATHITW
jgi:hypothetical protein